MSVSYSGGLADKMRRGEALARLVVEKTATDIAAGAAEKTPPKVDTGALQNSWAPRPVGDHEWEVINPIEYAKFVEYGSHHPARTYKSVNTGILTIHLRSRAYTIPPHPMLHPSAEEARPGFEAAIAQAFQ